MSIATQSLPDVRPRAPLPDSARVAADGKFLQVAGERFLVKGVTYGTFAPDADGYQFPSSERVAEEAGVDLQLTPAADSLRVDVDANTAERILVPLIENGCRYGRSRVEVQTRQTMAKMTPSSSFAAGWLVPQASTAA